MKIRLSKMRNSNRSKKGTYEVGFGYHSDLEVYTTLMSDIPKLYDIALKEKKR